MSIKVARILTGSGVRHNLTAQDQSGTAIDITSASISIALKSAAGTTLTTKTTGGGTVVIVSGSAGTFYVDWAASDYTGATAPTELTCVVTITLSSGKVHIEDYVEPLAATEPVSGRIVQLSGFKEYLGIPSSTDDNLLALCITMAQKAIERYCGVDSFASASYTEDIDGTGTNILAVKNTPITTLTSVSSLSRLSDGTEEATTVSSSSYRYDSKSGQITLLWAEASLFPEYWGSDNGPATFRAESPRWIEGFRNYRVVYTAGYATGSFPDDLQQACLEIASTIYRNRRVNQNMASESTSTVSYTAKSEAELAAGLASMLDQYRMQWV